MIRSKLKTGKAIVSEIGQGSVVKAKGISISAFAWHQAKFYIITLQAKYCKGPSACHGQSHWSHSQSTIYATNATAHGRQRVLYSTCLVMV